MKYIATTKLFLTELLAIFILLFQVLWNDYLVSYLSLIYHFGIGMSLLPLRDTLKAFDDFQERNKVYEVLLFESVFIKLYIEIIDIFKKFHSDKVKSTKKCSLFSFASSNS